MGGAVRYDYDGCVCWVYEYNSYMWMVDLWEVGCGCAGGRGSVMVGGLFCWRYTSHSRE